MPHDLSKRTAAEPRGHWDRQVGLSVIVVLGEAVFTVFILSDFGSIVLGNRMLQSYRFRTEASIIEGSRHPLAF
jgi:hypothetical protein